MTIVERALELVPDHAVVGLGSGRAAEAFIYGLGERVRCGAIQVCAIATSEQTADLARKLKIPMTTLADAGVVDITLDGADEVDPSLNLIKGYGRAMVREKVVAEYSRRFVILVGEEKLVERLGTRGKLPVEVLPFALPVCQRKLQKLGCRPFIWAAENGQPLTSDNGNNILDCEVDTIPAPAQLENDLRAVSGVVGTGLFPGMADVVLVGNSDNFELIEERSRG
jgi:ribose 5-phosphate isomerase A